MISDMTNSTNYIFIQAISANLFANQLNITQQQIAVLVDTNTCKFCYPKLKKLLPSHKLICIEAGEKHKNLSTCDYIWQQLTDFQFDRKALIINLGGGVIGDMGGFCAATYKRGIDFIQIPTTLLSQVDASVGGKLGVDFQGYKNHIGVFALPKAVIVDTNFLTTLSLRELKSGFAEVLKHCLIADKVMWKKLYDIVYAVDFQEFRENSFEWNEIVAHSIDIKNKITTLDPEEKGLRKILNFGHTIGHAIESFYLQTENAEKILLHGESIALGMIAESYLSYQRNLITQTEFEQIKNLLCKVYSSSQIDKNDISNIAIWALQDKKNENGQIQTCLLSGIGNCLYQQVITIREIEESLGELARFCAKN
jgi:3-dehydroquinate synthase